MPGKKPPLQQIRFERPFSRRLGAFGAGDELGPPIAPPGKIREPRIIPGCGPGSDIWTPGKPTWPPQDPPPRDISSNGMVLGHPLVLTASCTINPGDRQVPNVLGLRCPDNKAFLLEEIRFASRGDYAGFVAVDVNASVGCFLAIDAARILTPSIVPVAMFDAPFRQTHEATPSTPTTSTNGGLSRWRLPGGGLYLAPGEILTPTFEHFGLSNSQCSVIVTYHGRIVNQGTPRVRVLPFCTAWRPASFSINATTPVTLTSSEKDLINPFDKPLRVIRFGGRLYVVQTNVSGSQTTAISENAQAIALYDGTKLTIHASRGSDVVRTAARWLSVFDGESKGWDVDHVLPAGDHYVVTVDTGQNTTVAGSAGIAYVSMSGYREVG